MKCPICIFISVLLLAGCAHDYLATDLPKLEGQPVAQTLAYLGPPAEKKQADSGITYTWINNLSGSFYVPDTAPSPVVVQNGAHPTVAFSQPHLPPVPNTYNWHCRLDITAQKGVIVHTAYEGNAGGCQIFSEKLKPLIAETESK